MKSKSLSVITSGTSTDFNRCVTMNFRKEKKPLDTMHANAHTSQPPILWKATKAEEGAVELKGTAWCQECARFCTPRRLQTHRTDQRAICITSEKARRPNFGTTGHGTCVWAFEVLTQKWYLLTAPDFWSCCSMIEARTCTINRWLALRLSEVRLVSTFVALVEKCALYSWDNTQR